MSAKCFIHNSPGVKVRFNPKSFTSHRFNILGVSLNPTTDYVACNPQIMSQPFHK